MEYIIDEPCHEVRSFHVRIQSINSSKGLTHHKYFMKKLILLFKNNRHGLSLVEVLVALGILSISSIGITNLIQSYNKNIISIEEKLVILELEKNLINLSAGRNICEKKILENPNAYTFPISNFPPTAGFSIDGLFLSLTDSLGIIEKNKPLLKQNSVTAYTIEFQNISGSGNSYTADLVIKFKDTIIPRSPLITKVSLSGNIVGTDFALTSCTVADATLVQSISATSIDNETACKKIGGDWIQPGGNRPDFCSYLGEILEWY